MTIRAYDEAQIKMPHYGMLLLEPLRAALEFASLPLLATLPTPDKRGDGHSVLVIPGFGVTDAWTLVLRRYLTMMGYECEAWELGRNMGYHALGADAARLHDRVRKIYDSSGRKISIIGWSMGGVMARYAACTQPDMVRQVISLGAPFTGDPHSLTIRKIYELASGERFDTIEGRARFERDRAQPPVPSTSIFTKSDGIAAWQNCLEPEGPMAENIQVCGSHTGLTVNPFVLRLLVDRLAEPEGSWKPYVGVTAGAIAKPVDAGERNASAGSRQDRTAAVTHDDPLPPSDQITVTRVGRPARAWLN
ncbi:MAG: esterase/lipase family protein [Sphingobium sp.]